MTGPGTGAGGPIGEDELVAYADGRLDAARERAVEAWLAANPAEAARLARDREIAEVLRAALAPKAEEPVPLRLNPATIAQAARSARRARMGRIAAVLAVFVAGGAAGWALRDGGAVFRGGDAPAAMVADAAEAHRVFVVERRHPVEVTASEEAHLVAWLGNRLRHEVAAPDLGAQGFRLMGGRLLPSAAGPAGQIMYENAEGQRLTLYVRPEAGEGVAFRFVSADGAAAFYWVEKGLAYSLVGDLPRDQLMALARAAYRGLGGG